MDAGLTLGLIKLASKLVINLSKVLTLEKFNNNWYKLKFFLGQVKLFLGFNNTKFANNINKVL